MSTFTKLRGFWLLSALFTALPIACDTGGLVGGECREGRLVCGGDCIDPGTDPNNCGRCDNVCEPGYVCSQGDCSRPDGSGGGSGTGGMGSTEGGNAGAGAGNTGGSGATSGNGGGGGSSGGAGRGGAGPQGGTAGTGGFTGDAGAGGAECVPPYRSNEHCGACNRSCNPPAPYCERQPDGSYDCEGECNVGNVRCNGQCVDLDTDARNCGQCGNVCPSLRCIGGMCAGATPGHIALYCMDYAGAEQRTAHTRLLGNAFFLLPERTDIRILAFATWAPPVVRAKVNSVIGWEAARFGRTYTLNAVTTADDITDALTIEDYDVFLMYDQADAPDGELAALGTSVAPALKTFAEAGGVVVTLDGGQGVGEMYDFISSADLLQVDGQDPISLDGPDVDLYIQSGFDQLAVGVVSPLSAMAFSCTFDTPVAPTSLVSHVLTDAAPPALGSPVVIHRVVP